MSKIQELIKSDDTILVFDIDGTLARMEYGEYNHFALNDDEWNEVIESGECFYDDDQAIPTMVDYIKSKNIDNIYTCSKSYTQKEDDMKTKFLISVFGIKEDHIFYVKENDNKLDILYKIKESHKDIPDNHIAMVDDSLEVLNHIKENSDFATVHISSFM